MSLYETDDDVGATGFAAMGFGEHVVCLAYPGRRAVYLNPDGTYHQRRFTDPTDYPTFLGLLSVMNWRIRHE